MRRRRRAVVVPPSLCRRRRAVVVPPWCRRRAAVVVPPSCCAVVVPSLSCRRRAVVVSLTPAAPSARVLVVVASSFPTPAATSAPVPVVVASSFPTPAGRSASAGCCGVVFPHPCGALSECRLLWPPRPLQHECRCRALPQARRYDCVLVSGGKSLGKCCLPADLGPGRQLQVNVCSMACL